MRTILLFVLVAALMLHMWFVLPGIYGGAASAPSEATGHVFALNNHGRVVYVTETEKALQSIVTPVLFILVAIAAAIRFVGRSAPRDNSADDGAEN